MPRKWLACAWWCLLSIAACDDDGGDEERPCRSACLRVARCRQEARVGKPIEGERDPAPDARCMERCAERPDEWMACEHKMRSCSDLRGCYGPLR